MSEAVEDKSRRRRKRRSEEEDQEQAAEERGLTEGKGRATPGRRGGSSVERTESRGFLGGIVEYFQGVRDELDKVVWPDREELIRLSRIVLIVTVASALALGAISFVFTELFIFGFDDNEWIFGVVFLVVLAVAFAFQRMTANQDHHSPY